MRTRNPRNRAHLARHAFMQYSGLLFPAGHRFDHTERHGMDDRTALIETAVMDRLGHVIDPELGRSVTDLGMIAGVRAQPSGSGAYDVMVDVELTVPGCPLSAQISAQIEEAVASYPDADLTAHITVGSMDEGKLQALVSDLKAQRRENPFNKPGTKTRIFAVASGKGGVGKSSISANLAATFAALGYDTAAIDADIYGFSLPRLFGTHSQPTNLNGVLMPVTAWGVKLMSIGMFAGSDRAILWRGPSAALARAVPRRRVVGRAGCAHPRSGPRHRRYGDFSGAGAAERRTRRRHDPAAVRFRHRRAVRARRPAGADACAWGDREHELFRPRR
jgi:metal-sulfur cluster biosynthetic enzyme